MATSSKTPSLPVCLLIVFFLYLPILSYGWNNSSTSTEGFQDKPCRAREDGCANKVELLEYPWNEFHDKRPNRNNHLNHEHEFTVTNCVHYRPGFHQPRSDPNDIIGADCTEALHAGPGHNKWLDRKDHDDYVVFQCGPGIDNSNNSRDKAEYELRLKRHNWWSAEHCRAGCETCFDAMHEYGAEQAICLRDMWTANCEIEYRRKDGAFIGDPWKYYGPVTARDWHEPTDPPPE